MKHARRGKGSTARLTSKKLILLLLSLALTTGIVVFAYDGPGWEGDGFNTYNMAGYITDDTPHITHNQQPTTNNQQPTTNNQQPTL